MATSNETRIRNAYEAFNRRDMDAALQLMHPEVHWPNGWEGGYVEGHEGVRAYWTRQWNELNPHVTPVTFEKTADGRLLVDVQQLVKDKQGNLIFNGIVKHIYSIEDGLIRSMEIEHL